ncbi:hypothetical protein HN51_067536 [Arachis hypogaea]|nr:uncharacterized protein LOC107635215 [Arachis ipaensis]XP_025649720.1 uncharacterized protein LOC112744339 isoform X1 [Arachis hypogaea]
MGDIRSPYDEASRLLDKMAGIVEQVRKLINEKDKGLSLVAQAQKLASQHWIKAIVPEGDSMEAADRQMTWKSLDHSTNNLDTDMEEETMHKFPYWKLHDAIDKHKPEVTVQRMSSYAISASIFLWIFLIYSQKLLAKYLATKARVSIFIAVDMLGLLSFMVLAWALGVKILVGGKLSRMNCAMFLLWAILKLFKSDNSIDAVYLPILGIFFIGWHAMSSLDTKYQHC